MKGRALTQLLQQSLDALSTIATKVLESHTEGDDEINPLLAKEVHGIASKLAAALEGGDDSPAPGATTKRAGRVVWPRDMSPKARR